MQKASIVSKMRPERGILLARRDLCPENDQQGTCNNREKHRQEANIVLLIKLQGV